MMTDEDDLIAAMERRLSSALVIPGGWDRTFRTKLPVAWWENQPISWQIDAKRKPRPIGNGPTRTSIYHYLRGVFGFIAANPSKSGTFRSLEHNYVLADSEHETVTYYESYHPKICLPNKSVASAKEFLLESLAGQARAASERYRLNILGLTDSQRDLSSETVRAKDHKWFLLGDRGVGKTIFMNYVLTVHSPLLNKQRVIWTRLDLTKDAPPELGVAQWMRWKILKTLFQYYDQHSYGDAQAKYKTDSHEHRIWENKAAEEMVFDLSHTNADLFKWAQKLNNAMSPEVFQVEFAKLESKFRSEASADPENINDFGGVWFFDCIWNYVVVNKKCAFLLLFDGLDQLGLSVNDKQRFERLRAELQSFLTNEYYLPSACLITMREHSYREMMRNSTFRSGERIAVTLSVAARLIYERRVEFIRNRGEVENRENAAVAFAGETAVAFCNAYLKFCTWCLTNTLLENGQRYRPPTDDISEGFAILEQIYGNNRRKLFEALIKSVEFFLARLPEDFERWLEHAVEAGNYQHLPKDVTLEVGDPFTQMRPTYYLFVEALMLGDIGERFRKERYSYKVQYVDGKRSIVPRNFASTDSSLLFNVFHYPVDSNQETVLGSLISIRLLQFARSRPDGFEVDELIRWASEYLRYPEETTGQLVSEMLEGGILKYDANPYHYTFSIVVLGPQGEFLLDRLVRSLEYVSVGQQTSAVPARLLEGGLISIRPYRSLEFVSHNKVISVINFVRMLREIEKVEEKNFNQKAKGTGLSFSNFHGTDLHIAELIANGVRESIVRIIRRSARDIGQFERLKALLNDDRYWNLHVEAR